MTQHQTHTHTHTHKETFFTTINFQRKWKMERKTYQSYTYFAKWFMSKCSICLFFSGSRWTRLWISDTLDSWFSSSALEIEDDLSLHQGGYYRKRHAGPESNTDRHPRDPRLPLPNSIYTQARCGYSPQCFFSLPTPISCLRKEETNGLKQWAKSRCQPYEKPVVIRKWAGCNQSVPPVSTMGSISTFSSNVFPSTVRMCSAQRPERF